MTLTSGTRLGSYEILAPLGAGGMGEVYRARDLRLGREVAIKLVRPEIAHHPGQSLRFEREARLLASLNHPNIAVIHGLEEHDGITFLVMELVPGETLAERLARGPVPLAGTLEIGRQIALALEAAHEKGIIHRDLKPANVKLTPRGQVKLLDFGLAKGVAVETPPGEPPMPTVGPDPTSSGVIVGTPRYMSPEQARGQPLDHRTDIWSFGCLLYEALAGRPLFDGPSSADVLAAVLERPIDWTWLPDRTPSRLRELLRHCLERDRQRRLANIVEARRAIEMALQEPERSRPAAEPLPPLVLLADEPTAPVRPLTRPRRRRWPCLLVVSFLLCMACCAGGGYYLYQYVADLSLPWRPARNSVAVIPFDTGNPFPGGESDRVADSLAADITTRLTTARDLRVTPHSSATEYARSSPRIAAAFLHVRWLVIGKFEDGPGEPVRLRVELVDTRSETAVWTKTFSGKEGRSSSPAAREQLAAEIAREVQAEIMRPR